MQGRQSRLQLNPPFDFAFSAPGESLPPPQRITYGAPADIRRDIAEIKTTVSDIRHMLKSQEGSDGRGQSVCHLDSI